MRLKLLLIPYDHIDPNDGSKMFPMQFPPLGISTLTGYLRQHGVTVEQDDLDIRVDDHNESGREKIDMTLFSDQQRIKAFLTRGSEEALEEAGERILKQTDLRGYDVVGFSIVKPDNPSTTGVPLVLGKLIKERSGATVIMGGAADEITEEKLLASDHVDYGIIGDCQSSIGEVNALRFCLEFEKGTDLRAVPGVKWAWDGKLRKNTRAYSREETCIITTPTFDGLPMDLYGRERRRFIEDERYTFKGLILSYFFMRGCPYSCAFCCHSYKQALWAAKDPVAIASELKELSKRYNTPYFYFHNVSINPNYSFAERLAKELIEQDVGIKWIDCANLAPMDRPLLRKLKEAGAVRLVFGFESASPRILRMIGKPFTVPQAAGTLKAAFEEGIWTELDLICGFPHEREADTQETLRFLTEHQKYIMSCNINMFWVDGDFHEHPERYGIKLIANDQALHRDWSVTQYKEIGGLDWQERIALTRRTYEDLKRVIDMHFVVSPGIPEIFIYYENRHRLASSRRVFGDGGGAS